MHFREKKQSFTLHVNWQCTGKLGETSPRGRCWQLSTYQGKDLQAHSSTNTSQTAICQDNPWAFSTFLKALFKWGVIFSIRALVTNAISSGQVALVASCWCHCKPLITTANTKIPTSLVFAGEEQGLWVRKLPGANTNQVEIALQSKVIWEMFSFWAHTEHPASPCTERSPSAGRLLHSGKGAAAQLRAQADSCESFMPGNYCFVLHTFLWVYHNVWNNRQKSLGLQCVF